MKDACESYGDLFLNEDTLEHYLYRLLLNASFPEEKGSVRKKMGISFLGDAPITYSFKYDKKEEEQERRKALLKKHLRCVVEPGGRSVSVAGQIDTCLGLLDNFFQEYRWEAAQDVNRIVSIVYPKDKNETENWLSGMWIGMDSGAVRPAVKIYMNLRHQEKALRWERLKHLFEAYAEAGFAETFEFMNKTFYQAGIPVGIGCAMGERGLVGIRIYFAFPGVLSYLSLMKEVYTKYYAGRYKDVEQAVFMIAERFGDVESNLTMEFAIGNNGCLDPRPVRIKTELSLCKIPKEEQAGLKDSISGILEAGEFDGMEFREDWAFMNTIFDSLFVQYLSVGAGKEGEHFSVYLEPVMEKLGERETI